MNAFPSWPSFTVEEADTARDVILSNKVNQWTGDRVRTFEQEFAEWTGSEHAVAVTNGTLALELALRALDIEPGDEVIVSPRSFFASVSCVLAVGGRPVFADVDRDSGNLSAETIAPVLSDRTRAVVVVHLAGWPADMGPLMEMAEKRDFAVIEDCAQAHGAAIDGKMVGSIGHIGAWSFCQDKIMTTGGEGGMVTTDDPQMFDFMWSYKDHGKSRDAVFNRAHPPGFRWLHESFGTNWRMLEVQAAIGSIQLGRMKEWHELRTRNAMALVEVLRRHPSLVRVPLPGEGHTHAFYRLYGYLNSEVFGEAERNALIDRIAAAGFPAFHGSCSEIYLEKAFDGTDLAPPQRLPVAQELGATSIMFLTHPTIDENTLGRYCQAVDEAFSGFSA